MNSAATPLSAAAETTLMAHVARAGVVAQHVLDSSTALLDLSLEAGRSWMAQATVATRQIMLAHQPHEVLAMAAEQAQLGRASLRAYGLQALAALQRAGSQWQDLVMTDIAASQQKIGEWSAASGPAAHPFMMPLNTFFQTALQAVNAEYDPNKHVEKQTIPAE